jgi:hypothetical protein
LTDLEPKLKKDDEGNSPQQSKFGVQADLEEELEPVLAKRDVTHSGPIKESGFANKEDNLIDELEPML